MAIHLIQNRSGAKFRLKVPGRGIDQKTFQRRVAAGVYTVLELDVDADETDDETSPDPDDGETSEQTEPDPAEVQRIAAVLDGNVGEVIAHAQNNPDDVAALLAAEQAAAEPRKTVVDQLTASQGS